MRVRSLGWEDPLEEGMAMHSRILACRIPGTEEPGGLQSAGSQSQHDCSNLAGTDARTRQPHASPSAPLLLKPLSFIHPLLAALGLLWGVWAFSSCDEWAPLSRRRAAAAAAKSLQSCPSRSARLLIAVASLVGGAQALGSTGLVAPRRLGSS